MHTFLKTRLWLRQAVLRVLTSLDRLATRAARPTARKSPRPALLSDTAGWVAANEDSGVSLTFIRPSEVAKNDPPKTLQGKINSEYSLLAQVEIPPAYVLTIPSGRVVGEHGAVVTPDHNLLLDVSWPVGSLHSYMVHKKSGDVPDGEEFYVDASLPIRRVRGTVAALSAFYGRTYFHWVFDVLPRLGLLQDAGVDLADVDAFVVPGYFSGFQIETLTELGIRRNRVISSLKHRHVEAERLLVPSLPRRTGVVPTWVTEYLRRAFPPSTPAVDDAPSRIYIKRKLTDHGLLEGEDRLILELAGYGFKPIAMENYTLREKHWFLSRAEAVIGPSGAGLANIVFCRPGTKVIELRVQPMPLLESWDLANRCGLDFYDVLPSSDGREGERAPTDPWGMALSGSIADADIFAAIEMAGLDDRSFAS